MRSNKYLIMQINGDSALFVNSNFSGGRCASPSDNVTSFRPHDVPFNHENDSYWNSSEELLIGFCRWYRRIDEKESYHMGNRIYSASNTYRFFKIENEDQIPYANCDLNSYEITEETFILDMINSWEFKQVSGMFIAGDHVYHKRESPAPIKVDIVVNEETNSWCWTSDYLKEGDYSHLYSVTKTIPVGKTYEDAVSYISCTSGGEYRFGGND